MKNTLYINIFGSPGSGKSTLAAELFAIAKKQFPNMSIEYVPEFAKQFCYGNTVNEIFDNPVNQYYIGANQFYNIYSLDKKVDIVITDSPYLLTCIYNNTPLLGEHYNAMVKNIFSSHINLNIFLRLAPEKYQQSGRNENFEESKDLQSRLIQLLFENDIQFYEINDCEKIIELIKNRDCSNCLFKRF